jgi:hypothetical protein
MSPLKFSALTVAGVADEILHYLAFNRILCAEKGVVQCLVKTFDTFTVSEVFRVRSSIPEYNSFLVRIAFEVN